MTQEQMVQEYKSILDAQRDEAQLTQRGLKNRAEMSARTSYCDVMMTGGAQVKRNLLRDPAEIKRIDNQGETYRHDMTVLVNSVSLVDGDIQDAERAFPKDPKKRELMSSIATTRLRTQIWRTAEEARKCDIAASAMTKYSREYDRYKDFEGGIQK